MGKELVSWRVDVVLSFSIAKPQLAQEVLVLARWPNTVLRKPKQPTRTVAQPARQGPSKLIYPSKTVADGQVRRDAARSTTNEGVEELLRVTHKQGCRFALCFGAKEHAVLSLGDVWPELAGS